LYKKYIWRNATKKNQEQAQKYIITKIGMSLIIGINGELIYYVHKCTQKLSSNLGNDLSRNLICSLNTVSITKFVPFLQKLRGKSIWLERDYN